MLIDNIKINKSQNQSILAKKSCLSFSSLQIHNDNFFHLFSIQICEKVMKVHKSSFYIVLFKVNHKKMIMIIKTKSITQLICLQYSASQFTVRVITRTNHVIEFRQSLPIAQITWCILPLCVFQNKFIDCIV